MALGCLIAIATLAGTPSDERVSYEPFRGVTLAARGGDFRLTVRARAQLRDTLIAGGTAKNTLSFERMRLFFVGNLFTPELRYFVQLGFAPADFEPGNPSAAIDAFVEYTGWRDVHVRAGQFQVPFDRARTIRELAMQLTERAQVVRELTLDRDVGVMAWSDDLGGLGGRVGYALYLGTGAGKNRLAGRGGPLGSVRLVARPFGLFDDDDEGDVARGERLRLAVGLAGAYAHHATRTRGTLGDALELGSVDYAYAAADVVLKWRGLSLLSEVVGREALGGGALEGTSRSGWGWLVQAGIMVSSQVELTARWEQLYASGGTDPKLIALAATQGRQLGGGVNLYLHGHSLKVQTSYAYAWGPAPGPGLHTVHLLLDASF